MAREKEEGNNAKTMRILVTVLPLIVSVLVAMKPNDFKINLQDLISGVDVQTNLLNIGYAAAIIGLFVFWIVSLRSFISMIEEISNKKIDEAVYEVKTVIYRAPNFSAYNYLSIKYHSCQELLAQLDNNGIVSRKDRLREHEIVYSSILEHIIDITARFLDAEKESYSANIMLTLNNPKERTNTYKFIEKIRRVKELTHFGYARTQDLASVLHLPPGLNFGEAEDSKPPEINLPVLRARKGETPNILPGACEALLKGEFCVEDTLNIDKYYNGFSDDEKTTAKIFFENAKEKFRSYVSLRIVKKSQNREDNPNETVAIGVLNVNSSERHILGVDPTFYDNYYAMITPFLLLLSPYLEDYSELYVKDILDLKVEELKKYLS